MERNITIDLYKIGDNADKIRDDVCKLMKEYSIQECNFNVKEWYHIYSFDNDDNGKNWRYK